MPKCRCCQSNALPAFSVRTATREANWCSNECKSFYCRWSKMKTRCNNPKVPEYKNYGGRGITYCEEWDSFRNYFEDEFENFKRACNIYGMKHVEMDRANNSGNYCPQNVRWVTVTQNNHNRRYVSRGLSGYRNIAWDNQTGGWTVQMRLHRKRIRKFGFSSINAALAYRDILRIIISQKNRVAKVTTLS